ncbi:hypothetical protein BGW38_006404 [Lunasporangiospora selenospora]|uniref:Uncharacterized protein n=1 Tax=Lunasporangiospora selenospora TaxID=979761 RepID=A0A9P6KG90_9FUNG|nr:hypothetical protein BGW38_006404 [Lunasporangiospora selenospora]
MAAQPNDLPRCSVSLERTIDVLSTPPKLNTCVPVFQHLLVQKKVALRVLQLRQKAYDLLHPQSLADPLEDDANPDSVTSDSYRVTTRDTQARKLLFKSMVLAFRYCKIIIFQIPRHPSFRPRIHLAVMQPFLVKACSFLRHIQQYCQRHKGAHIQGMMVGTGAAFASGAGVGVKNTGGVKTLVGTSTVRQELGLLGQSKLESLPPLAQMFPIPEISQSWLKSHSPKATESAASHLDRSLDGSFQKGSGNGVSVPVDPVLNSQRTNTDKSAKDCIWEANEEEAFVTDHHGKRGLIKVDISDILHHQETASSQARTRQTVAPGSSKAVDHNCSSRLSNWITPFPAATASISSAKRKHHQGTTKPESYSFAQRADRTWGQDRNNSILSSKSMDPDPMVPQPGLGMCGQTAPLPMSRVLSSAASDSWDYPTTPRTLGTNCHPWAPPHDFWGQSQSSPPPLPAALSKSGTTFSTATHSSWAATRRQSTSNGIMQTRPTPDDTIPSLGLRNNRSAGTLPSSLSSVHLVKSPTSPLATKLFIMTSSRVNLGSTPEPLDNNLVRARSISNVSSPMTTTSSPLSSLPGSPSTVKRRSSVKSLIQKFNSQDDRNASVSSRPSPMDANTQDGLHYQVKRGGSRRFATNSTSSISQGSEQSWSSSSSPSSCYVTCRSSFGQSCIESLNEQGGQWGSGEDGNDEIVHQDNSKGLTEPYRQDSLDAIAQTIAEIEYRISMRVEREIAFERDTGAYYDLTGNGVPKSAAATATTTTTTAATSGSNPGSAARIQSARMTGSQSQYTNSSHRIPTPFSQVHLKRSSILSNPQPQPSRSSTVSKTGEQSSLSRSSSLGSKDSDSSNKINGASTSSSSSSNNVRSKIDIFNRKSLSAEKDGVETTRQPQKKSNKWPIHVCPRATTPWADSRPIALETPCLGSNPQQDQHQRLSSQRRIMSWVPPMSFNKTQVPPSTLSSEAYSNMNPVANMLSRSSSASENTQATSTSPFHRQHQRQRRWSFRRRRPSSLSDISTSSGSTINHGEVSTTRQPTVAQLSGTNCRSVHSPMIESITGSTQYLEPCYWQRNIGQGDSGGGVGGGNYPEYQQYAVSHTQISPLQCQEPPSMTSSAPFGVGGSSLSHHSVNDIPVSGWYRYPSGTFSGGNQDQVQVQVQIQVTGSSSAQSSSHSEHHSNGFSSRSDAFHSSRQMAHGDEVSAPQEAVDVCGSSDESTFELVRVPTGSTIATVHTNSSSSESSAYGDSVLCSTRQCRQQQLEKGKERAAGDDPDVQDDEPLRTWDFECPSEPGPSDWLERRQRQQQQLQLLVPGTVLSATPLPSLTAAIYPAQDSERGPASSSIRHSTSTSVATLCNAATICDPIKIGDSSITQDQKENCFDDPYDDHDGHSLVRDADYK